MQPAGPEARRQEVVSLLPPCLLSFSVPLLLPGVTITTVAFADDNPGFPKYGALHVVGMMLLALSVLLALAGIALLCFVGKRGGARVKPLDEEVTPAHSTQDSSGRKPGGAQFSTHTRRDGTASRGAVVPGDGQRVISSHPTHSHAAPLSSRSSEKSLRQPETAAVTSTLSPALAVGNEAGVGQYSVSSCSDQNETALPPLQPKMASGGRAPESGRTRCEAEDSGETFSMHAPPQVVPAMTPRSHMAAGPDSQHSSSPTSSKVAKDRLAEASDAARPRVASLPSPSVVGEPARTLVACHHQQTATASSEQTTGADYESTDDWARPALAEDFQEITRRSHGTRNVFSTRACHPDIHSVSSFDNDTSASLTCPEAPADCTQGLPFNSRQAATRSGRHTRQHSGHDDASTSPRAVGANRPTELLAADGRASSEYESSAWRDGAEASELSSVDEAVSWTSGDGGRQGEAADRVLSPAFDNGASSWLPSRSSVSGGKGVGKINHPLSATEQLFTRRSLDKSFTLQRHETAGRTKDGAVAPRKQRTSKDNDNDAGEILVEEFSLQKGKHSQEQRDSNTSSLVSIDQENIYDISPTTIQQNELCNNRSAPEQMELSDMSVRGNRSLSVFPLEDADDFQEDSRNRHKILGVTENEASFQPGTHTDRSQTHPAGLKFSENLSKRSNDSQRPEDTAANADAVIQRVKKVKKKRRSSRNVQGKTFDPEQTSRSQTTGEEAVAPLWSAVQQHCDTVMRVHLL